VQFARLVYIHGQLATTNSDGQSTCLTYTHVNLTMPGDYTYTGPINTDPIVVADGKTVTSGYGVEFLDLTSAFPDDELFKQCKYVMTNPPPVFLTPVNSIKLPQSTLPKTSNSASTTSISSTTLQTTSARPATPPIVVPSPTSAVTEEPSPPAESGNAPSRPPPSDDDDDEENDEDDEEQDDPVPSPPQESDNPSTPTQPSDNTEDKDDDEDVDPAPSPPQESDNTPNPSPSDDNDDEDDEGPAPSPTAVTPPGDNDDEEDEDPAPSPTVIPGTSAGSPQPPSDAPAPTSQLANTNPSPSQGQPDVPDDSQNENDEPGNTAAPPTTATQPESDGPVAPVTVSSTTSSILGLPSNSPSDGGNEGNPEIIVGGSTTIVAGGGVAVGSGTTFSVLPSSSGIVAVADGSTSTLPLPTVIPSAATPPDTTPQGVVVGGSTTIAAGGGVAVNSGTTFSVLSSTGGVIAIADGRTNTLPLPTNAPSANDGFVQPITSAALGFVLPGQTLSEGGEAVLVGGTSLSALPSGSGVVAISEGGSATLQSSQLSDLGISTAADDPDVFVLPSQTLVAGGSAAIINGATYSALPSGNSVNVVSSGQTSVIAVAEASNIPGVGEIALIDEASDGYVLGGSVTVLPGGTEATVSGTVYTALPSGFGVLASSDSDDFASYIEQGLSGEDQASGGGENYIIGAEGLAGQVATASGVVYSVLPSGSGVLVVASGQSTTFEIGPTGDNSNSGGSNATATGGSDTNESVVPYLGSSAPQTGALGSLAWIVYLSVWGFLGACLAF